MDKYILHGEYYKSFRGEDGEEPIGSTRIQNTYRPRVLHALWPTVRQSRDSIPAKTTKTRVSRSMLSNPKGSPSRPDSS